MHYCINTDIHPDFLDYLLTIVTFHTRFLDFPSTGTMVNIHSEYVGIWLAVQYNLASHYYLFHPMWISSWPVFPKEKKIQNFSMTFYNTLLDFPCFSPTSMGTLVNTKCIYTGNIRGSPIQSYNPLLFVSSDVDFFLTKKVTTIQNFSMAFHNTFLDVLWEPWLIHVYTQWICMEMLAARFNLISH